MGTRTWSRETLSPDFTSNLFFLQSCGVSSSIGKLERRMRISAGWRFKRRKIKPSYLRARHSNISRKHLQDKHNNRYNGSADTNLVTFCSSKYFARSASSMSKILFSKLPLKGINTAPGSFLSTHSFILINLLNKTKNVTHKVMILVK